MTELFTAKEIAFANVYNLYTAEDYIYYYPDEHQWRTFDFDNESLRFHKSILFSEGIPKVEHVTVGYARMMKPNDVITVVEVYGDRGGTEALDKFGPKHSHHFNKGTVLTREMAHPDVLDEQVFEWSGSGRQYVKVTEELLDWAAPFWERLNELATPRWLDYYKQTVRDPADATRTFVEPKTRELHERIEALYDELGELQNMPEQHEKRASESLRKAMDREAAHEAKKARTA